ncbi:LytR C-terminal domain-containing protein [Nocardioides sp. KIGAM211]|uniref:LytR C-terminal domain-containing protein n=2 Tax=Nocardioides luti TaxID=2761101 RepID=A0A7X0VBF7_9ACTN|nr:LytR C-terminal domain-containing protein [Nocardioides luti]MBB6628631.1 LytR C-terminal domain-containing protein [Nocardioides luti]
MLSIIAVAMAGIAYVATRGQEPTEREVTTVSRKADPTPTATPSTPVKTDKEKKKPAKPQVQRGKVYVEVYNNSGITGLAGRIATQATDAGWQVVGSDNWYGTIPTSTVYYPQRLKAAGKMLALDLGIQRVMPAVDGPMRLDRLTVVLTADAA